MAGTAEGPAQPRAGEGLFPKLDRFVFHIERGFAFISALCIFGLMLLGVAQILGRKLLNWPIFGYIDIVEIAMTTFAFLAISYCERLGGHVRMELLIGNLRGRILWLAELIGVLASLFAIAVLIVYGWDHFMRAYTFGDSTIDAQYPWWPSKLLVPIALSLLWLRLLLSLYGYARLLRDPGAEPIGVPVVLTPEEIAEREAGELINNRAGAKG